MLSGTCTCKGPSVGAKSRGTVGGGGLTSVTAGVTAAGHSSMARMCFLRTRAGFVTMASGCPGDTGRSVTTRPHWTGPCCGEEGHTPRSSSSPWPHPQGPHVCPPSWCLSPRGVCGHCGRGRAALGLGATFTEQNVGPSTSQLDVSSGGNGPEGCSHSIRVGSSGYQPATSHSLHRRSQITLTP